MPKFGINKRSLVFWSISCFLSLGLSSGCKIKTVTKLPILTNILQDKTATYDELLNAIRRNNEQIAGVHALIAKLHLSLALEKINTGIREEYRRGKGHILLKRPDSLVITIPNPGPGGGTIMEVSTKADDFKVWLKGKIYNGKNSAKGELVPENSPESEGFDFPARPQQIFEAILPPAINLDAPGTLISLEEQFGNETRFYIISINRQDDAKRIHIIQRIWIERTGLTIARQLTYTEEGKLDSDIQYSRQTQTDHVTLPLEISISRPIEGYSLKLEIDKWQINPADLEDSSFEIKHPGAEEIRLIEKKRGNVH
jgi:hypothetical protein